MGKPATLADGTVLTTPSGAVIEEVPLPEQLTPAQATEGTIVMQWYDDEERGKLYRIDSRRNPTQVNVTREDGKRFYMRISDLQLAPKSRRFPTLPDYLPRVGDLVHVRGVRGVKPTDVLFVGSVKSGKAKCHLLDNTHRSVSLPIANLTEVVGEVEVSVKG